MDRGSLLSNFGFHMSENGQDVHNRTAASRQMQEPAGVDEMSIITPINITCPAYCEKSTLFRHGILLPKIEFSPITQPRIGQSITFPVPIADQVKLKTDINDHVLPLDQCEIITRPRLKPHSSRHAV